MPVRFIHKRRSKISYCDQPVFLDCETAWNHDSETPKCWIVSIQVLFDDHYHLFRKPEELMNWYLEKIEQMNLTNERRLITYIHNASYDLSYLAPYIQMYLPDKDKRFGIYDGANKIITYNQGCLEFKCSYLLSGVSLAKWSSDMNIEHPKKIGLYDYNKILYQDSDLNENELEYDKLDVISMSECFKKQLQLHDDLITTVPLTSTGYSRRMLRKSCDNQYYRNEYFYDNRIDTHTLLFNVNSYAGGYTHNNRHKKSKVIIHPRLKHRDFRSHYPTQIRKMLGPWGKADVYYHITDHEEYKSFHGHYINISDILKLSPEYTTISHIRFYDMSLKDRKISMPFMQVSKIFNSHRILKDGDKEIVTDSPARIMKDNGRVLAMVNNDDECGYFETYIDNYTLQIIKEQYNIRYKVIEVVRIKNKPCPKEVADVIDKLFADKSNYKIIHKKCLKLYGEFDERTIEAAQKLMAAKKLLNAIYGVFATFPIREEMDLDCEHIDEDTGKVDPFIKLQHILTEGQYNEALNDFYSKHNNFVHYPIGCAVTAAARFELYEYIKTIGYENVLYCDTDSIYYISSDEIEEKIENLNAEKHKTAPFITNIEGNKIYYDVFEEEPDMIAFKGLHSKCYGYVTTNNELKAVIAGVPERTVIGMDKNNKPIYLYREEELAGITKNQRLRDPERKKYIVKDPIAALDNLKDDFQFKVNSGVTAKYIHDTPHIEIINGHEVSTAGGCIIRRLDEKLVHDWDFTDNVKITFSDIDIAL